MNNDNRTAEQMSQKIKENETVILVLSLLHYWEDFCSTEVLLQCLQQ